jgi:UDP-N-acetylglucosamine 2-epimerase (non-hydrolysing)
MKSKILIILGTRPEIIRLSCIIKKLEKNFILKIVNTNQNFDTNLNKIFFKELNLKKPFYNLNIKNSNPIEFISALFNKIDRILSFEKPNGVLVLGDTNSALSVFCAKKKKIPIFHLEAGNRCFDQRVPEEINRSLIDKLSDVNMTYSEIAKQNLIKENFDSDRVIKVGSPLFEVFNSYKDNIDNSNILKRLHLKKEKYLVVSCHREENIENIKNLKNIFIAVNKVSQKYKLKVIFSTHPRMRKKLKNINKNNLKNITFCKPFGFFDYIKLQSNSKLTLSDSGSIVEESNILNFPAVNLRETTERQEGMEKGFCLISSLEVDSIINSSEIILNKYSNIVNKDVHPDYSEPHVSDKITIIIQSFLNYINRKIWFKF